MDSRVRKQWFSILLNFPSESWIGKCLLIYCDDEFASYTTGEYQMYRNKFIPMGSSPKIEGGHILTHWLHDPRLSVPLPQGWPDCSIASIKEYLEPYVFILNQSNLGGTVAGGEAYSLDRLDTITSTTTTEE